MRQHIILVDLRGLSASQVFDGGVIRLVSRLTHIHDAHYPETLREAVIITSKAAETICGLAIRLVKPFLAQRTRQKLHLVSEDNLESLGKD